MELSKMKSMGSGELLSGYLKNPEHLVTVARRERLHESSKDLRNINIVKDTIEETTNLQRIKEGNPVVWQKLRETHKVQENNVSAKDATEDINLQENKGKNPVARRERLHKSSKDLRKIRIVKNAIEETTNLQRIKEGNPVVWQKLHETHMVQENYISVKDTIEEEKENPQKNRRTDH